MFNRISRRTSLLTEVITIDFCCVITHNYQEHVISINQRYQLTTSQIRRSANKSYQNNSNIFLRSMTIIGVNRLSVSHTFPQTLNQSGLTSYVSPRRSFIRMPTVPNAASFHGSDKKQCFLRSRFVNPRVFVTSGW